MTPCPAAAYLPPPRRLQDRPRRAPREVQLRLVAIEVRGDADVLLDLFGRLASDPSRTSAELQTLALLSESLSGQQVSR